MGAGNENQKATTPEYGEGHDAVFGLDCPYCDNEGWYVVTDMHGEMEQEQCQWCNVEPNSKFNKRRQLELDV